MLSDGISQLAQGAAALKDGTSQLATGGKELKSGTLQLKDGSTQLSEGMEKFDKEGVKKITDTLNGDVKTMLERLKAVERADKDYKAFDGQNDNAKGKVKFVIETAGIENK